jgi:copper transport protein
MSALRRWVPARVGVAVLGATVGALFGGLLMPAGPASAHAGLQSSTPAASSVLDTSPPLIVLDFDEEIDVPLTSIQLFDQDGATIAVGTPGQGADGSIVQSTVPTLGDGTFAVVWRVSSADGHIVTGAFSFQIGTTSDANADALIDTVLHGARAEPAVGRALGVSRFIAFAGATVLLGGLFMVLMVGDDDGAALGIAVRRLLWVGWVLLLIGSALNFGLLGANAEAGSLGDAFDTSIWGRIAATRTGELLVARLVVAAAWLVLLVTMSSRRKRWWQAAVAVVGLVTVLTFSGAGHPSVERVPAIWITLDAIHLTFVVVWLGSLVMMALGGRAWLRGAEREVAVRRFSRMATIGVPLIVVTGVIQAWRIGGGLSTLTDTSWGRLLLAKGAVAVLVVTIGGASRWLLQNDGPGALRRTVTTEALLGVAVLGLAAGLVGSPPTVGPQSRIYTQTLAEAGVLVDITITPGQVGGNEVHMVVTPPGGNLTAIAELTARMTLPSRDIPYVPVTIVAESPNHYTGNVTLPFPGTWTLEVVVSPEPSQSILLSSTVEIPDPNP